MKKLIKIFLITLPVLYLNPAIGAAAEAQNKLKGNEFKLNVELTGPAESVILNLLSPNFTCVFKNNNGKSMEFYKTEKFKVVTCGTIPRTLTVSVSSKHTRWGIKEPSQHKISLNNSNKDLSIKIETYKSDILTNVSGTVTDATGETVIGANVIFLDAAKKAIPGTNYGAATDSDGNYSIKSVPDNAKYIQVSSVGYNTEIRPLTKDSVYDIELTEDAQVLEEVESLGTNLNGKPCADDLLKKLNATKGTYTQHTETKKLYCNITKCTQHFETKNQEQDITYTVNGENSTQRQYMACSCKYETGADGTCAPPEKEEKIEVVPAPAPNDPRWSEEEIDAARDAAESARETENSDVNKLLGSVGMGATGIGGMMLMQGLSEKAADDDATRAMQAYISTFNCTYGSNRVAGGTVAEIPGGNELIALYSEYVNLANNLKSVKNELDMRAGIESEPILDSATSGLYDDVSVGGTSGAYASLARALMNPNGTDAAAWAEQTEKTSKNITTGAITAGAGAGVSMIGDLTNKLVEKKKAEKSTKSK